MIEISHKQNKGICCPFCNQQTVYASILTTLYLILISDQPIDKLSAIISCSLCVKLPCQACSPPVGGGVGIMPTEGLTDRPACLRSLSKVHAVT